MGEELTVKILGLDWNLLDLEKLALNLTSQKQGFLEGMRGSRGLRNDVDVAISQLANDLTSGKVSGIDFGNYWKFNDPNYAPNKAMKAAMEYANSIIAARGAKPKKDEEETPKYNPNSYAEHLGNLGFFYEYTDENGNAKISLNTKGWRGDDYAEDGSITSNLAGLASLASTLQSWLESLKDQQFDFGNYFKDREDFDTNLTNAIAAVLATKNADGTETPAALTNEERKYFYRLGLNDDIIDRLTGLKEVEGDISDWRTDHNAWAAERLERQDMNEAEVVRAMAGYEDAWVDELATRSTKPAGWDNRRSYKVVSLAGNANMSDYRKLLMQFNNSFDVALANLNEGVASFYKSLIDSNDYKSYVKTDASGRKYLPHITKDLPYYLAYDPKTNSVSIEWMADDSGMLDEMYNTYMKEKEKETRDALRNGTHKRVYVSAKYDKNGGILNKLKQLKKGGVLKAQGGTQFPPEKTEEQWKHFEDSVRNAHTNQLYSDRLLSQEAAKSNTNDSTDIKLAQDVAKIEFVPSYTTLMLEIGAKRKQADKEERKARARNVMYLDAALADLAALGLDFSSSPKSGIVATGLGFGSTLANFTADMMGKETRWYQDVGNLAAGLAADATALLPSSWGVAGKTAKIGSRLKKLLGYGLSTLGWSEILLAIPNGANIWNSTVKAVKGENMSVEDWKNVLQGISAIRTAVLKGNTIYKQRKYHTLVEDLYDAVGTKTTTEPRYLISVNKGKKYNISEAELKELQSKQTLEEANEYLRTITGDRSAELKVNKDKKPIIESTKLKQDLENPIDFHKNLRERAEAAGVKLEKETTAGNTVDFWYSGPQRSKESETMIQSYTDWLEQQARPRTLENPTTTTTTTTQRGNETPQQHVETPKTDSNPQTSQTAQPLQLPTKTSKLFLQWAAKKGLSQEAALNVLKKYDGDYMKAMAEIVNNPKEMFRSNATIKHQQLPVQTRLTNELITDLLLRGIPFEDVKTGMEGGLSYEDMVEMSQYVKSVKRNGGKLLQLKALKKGGILKALGGLDFKKYKWEENNNLTGFELFKHQLEAWGEDASLYDETNFTSSPEFAEMLEAYPEMAEKLTMTKTFDKNAGEGNAWSNDLVDVAINGQNNSSLPSMATKLKELGLDPSLADDPEFMNSLKGNPELAQKLGFSNKGIETPVTNTAAVTPLQTTVTKPEESNHTNALNSYVDKLKALTAPYEPMMLDALSDAKRRAILSEEEEEIDTNEQLVNEEILSQIDKDSNEIQAEFNEKFNTPVNPSDKDFYSALATYKKAKESEGNGFLGVGTPLKDKYIRNQQFSKTPSNLSLFMISNLANNQIYDIQQEGIRNKLNADLLSRTPFQKLQQYDDSVFNTKASYLLAFGTIYDQIAQALSMGQDTTALMNTLADMTNSQTNMINNGLNQQKAQWQETFNENAKSNWEAGQARSRDFGTAAEKLANNETEYVQLYLDNLSKLESNQAKVQEQNVADYNYLANQYNDIVDNDLLTPELKKEYINKLKLKGLRIPNNVGLPWEAESWT